MQIQQATTIDKLRNIMEFIGKVKASAIFVWLLMSSEFSAGQHRQIESKVKSEKILPESLSFPLLSRKFHGKVKLRSCCALPTIVTTTSN